MLTCHLLSFLPANFISFFLRLTGELTKNLIGFWLLTTPTYSFHDNAPSHSRFSGCLVQKARFCEKNPGCTLSGRSRVHGTIDQFFCELADVLAQGLSLLSMWHLLQQVFPDLPHVSLFWFSFRITVLVAAICRQFRTSSVRAFTQSNISGFSVLGTFTPMQEHLSIVLAYLSKIITNAGKNTDVIGWTDDHWRWSACFHHVASILLWWNFCILSGLDAFVQDTHP